MLYNVDACAKDPEDCEGRLSSASVRTGMWRPTPGRQGMQREPGLSSWAYAIFSSSSWRKDESSSSEMSFTAPASSSPATLLPVSKKAKAAPRDEDHPKGQAAAKQPPKKKTRQAEQVPEPAVAPKAAPAKLEIPAVVPLNVHDRRWGTSLQPSRESCELAG